MSSTLFPRRHPHYPNSLSSRRPTPAPSDIFSLPSTGPKLTGTQPSMNAFNFLAWTRHKRHPPPEREPGTMISITNLITDHLRIMRTVNWACITLVHFPGEKLMKRDRKKINGVLFAAVDVHFVFVLQIDFHRPTKYTHCLNAYWEWKICLTFSGRYFL